jgi:hypothetical protein
MRQAVNPSRIGGLPEPANDSIPPDAEFGKARWQPVSHSFRRTG